MTNRFYDAVARRLTRGFSRRQAEFGHSFILAAAIGMVTALGSLGFRSLIHAFAWIFFGREKDALRGYLHIGLWATPIILLSGGVVLLILDYFYPGDVLGYGFPNFLETVNLGNARLRRRWIVLKALGAALSLGSGASVGREGPVAQIGGAIGSACAQLRRLPAQQARILIAAGAGAGIATTFSAPLGGMMFAQEIILLGETELGNLTLVLIATATAVVTSHAIIGMEPVFTPPSFVIGSYWQLLTYGAMGLMLGVLAAAFVRFFHATGRRIRVLPIGPRFRLIAGLGLVGLIAIPMPQNLADGYPVIEAAIQGRLTWGSAGALAAAKFGASAISLQAGAPGGMFGPLFFIGAMTGAAFRGVAHVIVPGLTGPVGSYALVALGAFLSAVTNAPLTALLLLFEMTRGDWTIVVPAMVSTLTALIVARVIEPDSIDTYGLSREGAELEIGRDRRFLAQLPVSSVLRREVVTVNAEYTLADVMRAASDTTQSTLPVLNHDGGLAGLIVIRDLLRVMGDEPEIGRLVNATDLSRPNPPLLRLESNLDQALQTMESENLEELPVAAVESGEKFLGLVVSSDLAATLSRMNLSMASLAERDTKIFWASGYRVTRLPVPAFAVGKTLRELELRGRYGVSVLAVRHGVDHEAGFKPPAIDHPFDPDDTVIVAGPSAALRAFAREARSSTLVAAQTPT